MSNSPYYKVVTNLCLECNSVRCYKVKLICQNCRFKLEKIERTILRENKDNTARRYNRWCVDCGEPTNTYKNTCDLCFFIKLKKSKGESIFDMQLYDKTPLWSKEQCFRYIKTLEDRNFNCDLYDLLSNIPHCAESLNLLSNLDGLNPSEWVRFLWKRIYPWYLKQKISKRL